MKKVLLLSGLCLLLFFSSIHSSTFAFTENNRVLDSQVSSPFTQSITIYNPYEEVDFDSVHHYKANLHTHTTESDGSSDPSEVIYHYHDIGNYDILSITDHSLNTWPWTDYIDENPVDSSSSSAYYPDLNLLAISGNELSLGHHRSSLLNDYPFGGFFMHFAFWKIQQDNGVSFFNHPGRYSYNASWYQHYFDWFDDCVVGVEVFNQGDRYPTDRMLWDEINRDRNPDDLIWGFSNDDMHRLSSHAFRNYQHFLMDELTEDELRSAMIDGSFYFSYEPDGADDSLDAYGQAMTPKLTDVTVDETIIHLTATDYISVEWYDQDSEPIGSTDSQDVSCIDSNFVRAVFSNEYGKTFTQPFGIQQ